VLTPRIHSTVKYNQLRQRDNICEVSKRPLRTIAMTANMDCMGV